MPALTTVFWMNGLARAGGVAMSRQRRRRSRTPLPALSAPGAGRHVEADPQRASSMTQPGVGEHARRESSQSGAGSSPGAAAQGPALPSTCAGAVRRCSSSQATASAEALAPITTVRADQESPRGPSSPPPREDHSGSVTGPPVSTSFMNASMRLPRSLAVTSTRRFVPMPSTQNEPSAEPK